MKSGVLHLQPDRQQRDSQPVYSRSDLAELPQLELAEIIESRHRWPIVKSISQKCNRSKVNFL